MWCFSRAFFWVVFLCLFVGTSRLPGKTQICMLQEAKRLVFVVCVIAHKGGREVKGETILTCFREKEKGGGRGENKGK